MTPNLRFGRMVIENFGPFVGRHEFNWDRGPSLWYISGRNLKAPALGANGAGKTTLLVALFWVLFGRTLRNVRPGERVEPWHATGTTSVELILGCGDDEHVVYRSRKPNKLTLDSVVVVDETIQKLLPAPEVILYSFILGQSNTLFLDLKPEPQSQLFTDLLDLDVWLDAADRAGDAAKAAEREIEQQATALARVQGQLEQVETSLDLARRNEAEYEAVTDRQLAALDTEITNLKKQEAAAQKEMAKWTPDADEVTSTLEAEHQQAAGALRGWEHKHIRAGTTVRAAELASKKLVCEVDGLLKTETCPTCGTTLANANINDLKALLTTRANETKAELDAARADLAEADEQFIEWSAETKRLLGELSALRTRDKLRQTKHSDAARVAATTASQREAKQANRQELADSVNPWTAECQALGDRQIGLLDDADRLAGEKRESEAVRDTSKLWQDGFRSIRLSIIESTLVEVSMAANRHADRLGLSGWQIELATERETKKGTTSIGFTAFLYPPEVDKPIPWDSYSGGESTRWQLAVAFGLGEVLLARAGIVPSIEIYDESTKGLSTEGISDLMDCLRERAQETGRTIFMIDHHALSHGAFDGVITVTKDQNGSHILEM